MATAGTITYVRPTFGAWLLETCADNDLDFGINEVMNVWLNGGPFGTTWSWIKIDGNFSPGGTATGNYFFGDLNGDGKADMAVGQADGTYNFYISQGDIGSSNWSWKTCVNKAPSQGANYIWLQDIDGDGTFR